MDMYGKFTWKIENFSEISKRELRSNVFEVGGYKWYILVYPQGCDVSNHLSLFLCVADYDKLLPGWSHFAQFTIAVVNKDPKKSKYSDTLHRFCKKEHDWGWKKFMELSKVLDGFTVSDTLVIKAQVQVIHEKISRPFRCLDSQYRRELVRVYLTNVEGICRRFLDEKREKLMLMRSNEEQWANLRHFWNSRESKEKALLTMEKSDILLRGIVKRFFNEKEVTSTLVMDALYCGCRTLDIGEECLEKAAMSSVSTSKCSVALSVVQNKCVLTGDLVAALERAVDGTTFDPDEESKKSDDLSASDAVERDEKRLAELGRRTIEMYVLSHVFVNQVEKAFKEAEALMRQEALIAEEEEAERLAQQLEGAKKSKKQKQKERQRQKKALEDAEKAEKEAEEARQREEIEAAKEAERAVKAAAKAAALAEERAREEAEAAAKAKIEAEARALREAKAAVKAAEKAKRDAEEKAKEDAARKLRDEAEAKERAEAAAKALPSPKPDSPSTPSRTKSAASQVSSPSKVIPVPISNEVSTLRSRISQLELQLEEKTSECVQLNADLDKAKDIILQLRSDMNSGRSSSVGEFTSMPQTSLSMDSLDVARTAQVASAMLGDTTNLVHMGSSSSLLSNGHSASSSSAMQPVMQAAKSQPPLPPGPPPPTNDSAGPPPPPRGPPPPGSARVADSGTLTGASQLTSASGLPPSFAAMAAGARPPEPPSAPPGMNGAFGQRTAPPPPGMGNPNPLGTPPSMKPPPGMGHPSTWSPGIQEEFPHLGMISDLLDFD
jgi:hypothetical protein